jgi:hypothetical protein
MYNSSICFDDLRVISVRKRHFCLKERIRRAARYDRFGVTPEWLANAQLWRKADQKLNAKSGSSKVAKGRDLTFKL